MSIFAAEAFSGPGISNFYQKEPSTSPLELWELKVNQMLHEF